MAAIEPSADQVQRWLDAVERQLLDADRRIEPLLVEQARLQERRALLKDLLGSLGDHHVSASVASAPSRPARRESVRERVHREAVTVFQQIGRPLHINDLTEEYVRRGYRIPGQGKPANLSVHLSGWPDIMSPTRGIYGLRSMFDEPAEPGQRKGDS